jgi:hypothetical protein
VKADVFCTPKHQARQCALKIVSVRAIEMPPAYSCHYCYRSEGAQTKDHKVPRLFGGTGIARNIVRCCQMCNSLKAARPYELFVFLFREFLEVHGREYREADPDDPLMVGTMTRKFNMWLHALHHARAISVGEGIVEGDVAAG